MASSSMAFGVYQAQNSNRLRMRFSAPMRTWLPVLACAMVFAVESTSYFGSDRTSAPLLRAAEAIFGYDVGLHWNSIHHFIRKTGHFMGYGAFCVLCFRGFWIQLHGVVSGLSRQLKAHGLAILITFLIASADELHQSFLPNRTGQFSDVLLDTCGGAALGLVLFLVMQATRVRRLASQETDYRRKAECAEAAA